MGNLHKIYHPFVDSAKLRMMGILLLYYLPQVMPVQTLLLKVCLAYYAFHPQTIFYKGIMPSEVGFRFSSGL